MKTKLEKSESPYIHGQCLNFQKIRNFFFKEVHIRFFNNICNSYIIDIQYNEGVINISTGK